MARIKRRFRAQAGGGSIEPARETDPGRLPELPKLLGSGTRDLGSAIGDPIGLLPRVRTGPAQAAA